MKQIVVINGNPIEASFCSQLARAYVSAARDGGARVELFELGLMKFDPVLRFGYGPGQPLEADLVNLREQISQADHLVFVFPVWWGSVPAVMKGMLDRVFLPGFAFAYQTGALFPQRLLKGKSARLLVTMDTPIWYFRWIYGSPVHRMMKDTVLRFCGVRPVRIREFAPMNKADGGTRARWLEEVAELGSQFG